MEAAVPMVIFFLWKFFYFFPSLMYSTMPIPSNQISLYGSTVRDQGQIYCEKENNWFGLCSTKKQNSGQSSPNFKPIALKTPMDSIQLENPQEELKKDNLTKGPQKRKSDKTEYVPHQKQQEKKSNTAYLNEFRNILPNTIHQILSYIQRKNKSIGIISKLVKKYATQRKVTKFQDESSNDGLNEELSVTRFYAYQNHLKNKLSNYVTLQTFKFLCTDQNVIYDSDIFTVNEQKIYNKICRIAILYYLEYEVVCVLMSSKRMQKSKKWEHLKINRKIENYIRSGFKVQSS